MKLNRPAMLYERLIDRDTLGRLSAEAVEDSIAIEEILHSALRKGVPLTCWVAKSGSTQSATIQTIDATSKIHVRMPGHGWRSGNPIFFDCRLGGRLFFFLVRPSVVDADSLTFRMPTVIHVGERRDRSRSNTTSRQHVVLLANDQEVARGDVLDRSPGGLGVTVPSNSRVESLMRVRVRFPAEEAEQHDEEFGEIRSVSGDQEGGWKRLGLVLLPTGTRGRVASEWHALKQLTGGSEAGDRRDKIRRSLGSLSAAGSTSAPTLGDPGDVRVVRFLNSRQEQITAILDVCGDASEGPAVVIPPAWGKTKETLLSLSAVIQSAFRASGQSVSVLRFDGVRRRGESHNDSDCTFPGLENLRFTFSQAVDDLRSAVSYVRSKLNPASVIVVTFSAASIEGRRVVADESGGSVDGWISVVGAPDPQSLIRSLTGGVDYFANYEAGRRSGKQEIQGLYLDVDNAARDAIENRLAFLEDARADLARIKVPITWIHGEHDAWLEVDRVEDILSIGNTENRRLIVVPTGHQLRNSREALEVFNLVACEVGRIGLRREVQPAGLDPRWLSSRRKAERSRLNRTRVDVRDFWRAYLLGRDGELGVELVANTDSYQGLMRDQVEALTLSNGQCVVDLGCGIGMFPRYLFEFATNPAELRIIGVDYVREALRHARTKAREVVGRAQSRVDFVVGDLDLTRERRSVPLATESADRALASLVINYLEDPSHLLREAWRILRPSGLLVLSSLKEDADTSRICVRGVGELRAGASLRVLDEDRQYRLDQSLREFISDAGRLIDFEEQGVFRFWSEQSLIETLEGVGFAVLSCRRTFGDPAQALLITARKS